MIAAPQCARIDEDHRVRFQITRGLREVPRRVADAPCATRKARPIEPSVWRYSARADFTPGIRARVSQVNTLDSKKLDALRQKYADAKGGDIFDPEFAAVAAQVFSDAERRKWPFADPATFLGAAVPPRRARRCRTSAGSTSRSSACRWTWASPIAPARGSGRGRCAPSSASVRTSTCCASRRSSHLDGRRHRRRADAKPVQPRPVPRRHRGVLHADLRGRRHPARGRRRPLDHLFDPQGRRPRAPGRHGAHRRALRHRRANTRARSSITAARSGRRCSPACSIRSARSRSASAAAPNTCGSSRTTAG